MTRQTKSQPRPKGFETHKLTNAITLALFMAHMLDISQYIPRNTSLHVAD